MLHKNRDEILEMSISNVARAKNYLDDVQFSPMDATRTEPEYLYALLEAVIDAGATTVNIPDTVGYSIPSEFGKLLIDIQKNVKNINKARLSVHCHNDLGLSVANSLAAVQAGARQVEGCINGLGERAGNAATEEIIMALATRKDYFGVNIEIDTTQLTRTSRLVSEITGFAVQKNKAIVGLNAFRHASGIHQDGILKEKSTYEIIDPISVGLASNSLVLAKLSGRAGLRARLEELGYKLSTEDLDLTFLAFKDLADKKREITDRDLEALMGEQRRITQMNNFQIIDVEVHTGSKKKPSATVTLANSDGVKFSETCDGNGPVDAVCKAIATVIGIHPTLEEYSVRSITGELDAVGDVTVKLNYNNQLFSGRGADTDIILASAKAYTNAINRMLA
jgi:2-isopropylmalate synthase